ncbi:Tat pathway signal sequence domain protein [Streptomyces sp. NPDC005209]|uniref:Tat pathway signal sequence domain protein n=1 Tax=Streptomyces sp. NPDC005209 TaxID=3156715 RepID=UPI0033BD68B2
MSGVGPVEPGEGTRAREAHDTDAVRAPGRTRTRLTEAYARHRRAALALAVAAAVLAGGGYLYATRPKQPPPPEPPYPAQAVEMAFLNDRPTAPGAPPRSFSFEVSLTVLSGPPVTVTRVTQPYAGLWLSVAPRAPFRTKAGAPRKITITMHVTDCGKVPKDAGLPFLEVTLRNARAMQAQSFILGERYAQHLSEALQVACGNGPRNHQNA